jgi:hypothetical protein
MNVSWGWFLSIYPSLSVFSSAKPFGVQGFCIISWCLDLTFQWVLSANGDNSLLRSTKIQLEKTEIEVVCRVFHQDARDGVAEPAATGESWDQWKSKSTTTVTKQIPRPNLERNRTSVGSGTDTKEKRSPPRLIPIITGAAWWKMFFPRGFQLPAKLYRQCQILYHCRSSFFLTDAKFCVKVLFCVMTMAQWRR